MGWKTYFFLKKTLFFAERQAILQFQCVIFGQPVSEEEITLVIR
jgi:hypothetical protein